MIAFQLLSQKRLKIAPGGICPPLKKCVTAPLQFTRQFSRQGRLAVSARAADEQAGQSACQQAVFKLAQLLAPSNKTHRDARFHRSARLGRKGRPVCGEMRRLDRDQHRQAPLSMKLISGHHGTRLAARYAIRAGGHGGARGLNRHVGAFALRKRFAQRVGELNARFVQHRFAHPHHVWNAHR